jgi:hypothetical protein
VTSSVNTQPNPQGTVLSCEILSGTLGHRSASPASARACACTNVSSDCSLFIASVFTTALQPRRREPALPSRGVERHAFAGWADPSKIDVNNG